MLAMSAKLMGGAALSYGAEKLFDAGLQGLRAFQAGRAARRVQSPAECLNDDPEPTSGVLEAFRIEVAVKYPGGATGLSVHENVYCIDSDAAMSWALRHYMGLDEGRMSVTVTKVDF